MTLLNRYATGATTSPSGLSQNNRTYLQFNEAGSPGYTSTATKYCPNWGYPSGWGMMQVEGPLSPAILWDWKMNIEVGKYILQQKYSDPKNGASVFWGNQRQQFRNWNNLVEPDVAPPADRTFNGITFAYERTGNKYSYEDAIWIKQYNGAKGNYIVWDNETDPENPKWKFHDITCYKKDCYDYVEKVCNKLP